MALPPHSDIPDIGLVFLMKIESGDTLRHGVKAWTRTLATDRARTLL